MRVSDPKSGSKSRPSPVSFSVPRSLLLGPVFVNDQLFSLSGNSPNYRL